MDFIDYDSISDKLFWFDGNLALSITVKLGRKDKYGNRRFFHSEYSYETTAYKDIGQAKSIKRNYDSFLTIDGIDKQTYIQIRLENILIVRYTLEYIAKEWLLNDDIWAIKGGKLMLKGEIKPKDILNLPMNKWLSFSPTPIIDINNQWTKGVKIAFSDYNNCVDITVDKFMGLLYIFSTINLFEQSAIMLNYISNSDIYGINTYDPRDNEQPVDNFKGPNRQIPKKNFFK